MLDKVVNIYVYKVSRHKPTTMCKIKSSLEAVDHHGS